MIEVQHVSKRFGRVEAVRDVSVRFDDRGLVGLLGPNGAGKTTLIRMVTGFLPPSAGTVAVDGHDTVADSMAARRNLGYLPESTPLYTEMRVEGFLRFRAGLYGFPARARRDAANRAIERCWLRDVRRRRIGELSKGYRQRVGLAAAMLHAPRTLVLDEPTSGLDPSQVRETRRLLRELADDHAVLLSSHILPEIEQTCDRVVIMARGRVRADGPPGALLDARRETLAGVLEADPAPAGGPEALRGLLAGVPGVSVVGPAEHDPVPPWMGVRLVMRTADGDVLGSVGRALARAGVPIRRLEAERPTLERVFLDVVGADEPAAP